MVPVAPVLVLAVQLRVTDAPPVADTPVGGASVAAVNAPMVDDVSVNRARLTGIAIVSATRPSARIAGQRMSSRRCAIVTSGSQSPGPSGLIALRRAWRRRAARAPRLGVAGRASAVPAVATGR